MNTTTVHIASINTEHAEKIIDTISPSGILMDPALLEKLLFRLAGDTNRSKLIHSIAKNTALHCIMIISNPIEYSISSEGDLIYSKRPLFTPEQISKAKQDLSRYESIIATTSDIAQY